MTQATPIIGANQSGLAYRTADNSGKTALMDHHKGSTAPGYAAAGIIWLDDTATPWILKIYDGTDWITIGTVNATTNVFVPSVPAAGTVTASMLAAPASVHNAGTAGGTANAQTLTPTPALGAYAAGVMYSFLPVATNTSGTVTVNVSSLGARNIKKFRGGAVVILAVGDLVINGPAFIVDDGTQFILLKPQTYTQGADVASATTTNLDTATGDYTNITGTTTITGITLSQGRQATIQFSGVLTLTNGASLILPGGSSIVTAAGDTAILRGEASGVVRCISYTRATGFAPVIGLPQNSKSAAYTTVLTDNGKHIFHPAADTTARTWTIDSNANVAYPVGAALTFVNENGAGVITIAITSDTMRLAGAGTTGSRTLAANGIATALKITSTSWIISGTGLT
jgi:hypothetical protein